MKFKFDEIGLMNIQRQIQEKQNLDIMQKQYIMK